MDGNRYTVKFVDYGNTCAVTTNEMRHMDPTFMTLPKQAVPCKLAGKTLYIRFSASFADIKSAWSTFQLSINTTLKFNCTRIKIKIIQNIISIMNSCDKCYSDITGPLFCGGFVAIFSAGKYEILLKVKIDILLSGMIFLRNSGILEQSGIVSVKIPDPV